VSVIVVWIVIGNRGSGSESGSDVGSDGECDVGVASCVDSYSYMYKYNYIGSCSDTGSDSDTGSYIERGSGSIVVLLSW